MMDYDLTGLREAQKLFTLASVKHYMRQILIGIAHLHKERIIHRDLKGANILISRNHTVKIADFGLSRQLEKARAPRYTNPVVCRLVVLDVFCLDVLYFVLSV